MARVRATGASGGGGGGLPSFAGTQYQVPGGSSYKDIPFNPTKNYILFWNLKSTDNTQIYNGMWTLYSGVLDLVIGGNYVTVSIVNTTTLRVKNNGSSILGECILAEMT